MRASKMTRLTVLTAAPAYMSLTAARTVRAERGTLGRSRSHRPQRIRSAASARPGRRWPSGAPAISTARSTPGCVQAPRIPFVVAANGPRSMRIAARFGQGWVTSGTRTDDLEQWWQAVAVAGERFTEALDAAGRGAEAVPRYLSLDAAPVFSLSSAAYFDDAISRASELGFTDALTHWPRPDSWYAGSESVLEEAAADVLPRWHTPAAS